MFMKMTTYDSEYGDAIVFDEYVFSAQSYEEFIGSVLARFDELIKGRTLLIDRESGFTNVVETRSGSTAESYIVTYPSEQDLMDEFNGISLANSIFYDPDAKTISCGLDAYSYWDRLCDEDDEVIEAWGLTEILNNRTPQLDSNNLGLHGGLEGWDLVRLLFDLYSSLLKED